ncbi:50S ribosome-binding GTPase [Candidatus Woesebacteria bacterium]|nr:50S ribosome-binding GTPase [Candidatus Woesebacteria bacterium]
MVSPVKKQQKSGNNGDDLELKVPVGTVIWEVTDEKAFKAGDKSARTLVGEIMDADDRLLVAKGGLGGRGNVHFKSSTNRTPLEYEIGGAPQEKKLFLELKLLADIGFVGLPNAGKSTLLSVLTDAKPKVADYPFTTLEPHLGVMSVGGDKETTRYVVADVPGLIEAASAGKGLGHQFLRHIERCRLLVYVLAPNETLAYDADTPVEKVTDSVMEQWNTLRTELENYNPELLERPVVIVLNKQDMLAEADRQALLQAVQAKTVEKADIDGEVVTTSAITQEGIEELKNTLHEMLLQHPTLETAVETAEDSIPVYTPEDDVGKPVLTRKEVGNWRKL